MNHDIDNLINEAHTVRYLRAQGMTWTGHLERLYECLGIKTMYEWRSE